MQNNYGNLFNKAVIQGVPIEMVNCIHEQFQNLKNAPSLKWKYTLTRKEMSGMSDGSMDE